MAKVKFIPSVHIWMISNLTIDWLTLFDSNSSFEPQHAYNLLLQLRNMLEFTISQVIRTSIKVVDKSSTLLVSSQLAESEVYGFSINDVESSDRYQIKLPKSFNSTKEILDDLLSDVNVLHQCMYDELLLEKPKMPTLYYDLLGHLLLKINLYLEFYRPEYSKKPLGSRLKFIKTQHNMIKLVRLM